jgi:hypothetical protein
MSSPPSASRNEKDALHQPHISTFPTTSFGAHGGTKEALIEYVEYVNKVMNKRTLQAVMSACRIHARAADRTVIMAIVIAILIVNLAFRMVSYLFSDTMEKTAILLLLLNTLHTWTKDGDVDGGVRSSENENRYASSELGPTEGH